MQLVLFSIASFATGRYMDMLQTLPILCEGHHHLHLKTAWNGQKMSHVGELIGHFIWNAELLLKGQISSISAQRLWHLAFSLHLLKTIRTFVSSTEWLQCAVAHQEPRARTHPCTTWLSLLRVLEVGWYLVCWPDLPSWSSAPAVVCKAWRLKTKSKNFPNS